MEVNMEMNPTVWRKQNKAKKSKLDEFILTKINVKRFSFDNLHRDFKIMKNVVHTTMDVRKTNTNHTLLRKLNMDNFRMIRKWKKKITNLCCLVSVQVVHPYSSIDTTAAFKNGRIFFIS